MALETQYIQIALAEGIDTKTDEKLVVQTKLTHLSNGKLAKTGTVQKRNGYDQLSQTNVSGGSISSGEALGIFKDELILFDQGNVYSRADAIDGYINRGFVNPVVIKQKPVFSGASNCTLPDWAINLNIMVSAWQDSRGGIRAQVIDLTNHSVLLSDQSISTTDVRPRVIALGTYIYVFYLQSGGTNIRWKRIDVLNPTAFGSQNTLGSSSLDSGRQLFDIVNVDSDTAAYAYSRSGGGVTFGTFAGALSTPTNNQDAASVTENADNCICVIANPSTTNIWVNYFNATNGLRCFIRSLNLTQVLAPTTVDSQLQPAYKSVTGEFISFTQVRWVYEQTATSSMTFAPAAVTTGTDTINLPLHNLVTGEVVQVSSATTLPNPLVAATNYFVIVVDANNIKLATTDTNALSGVVIDITTQGVGTHTITATSPLRWTGVIKQNTLTQAGSAGTASTLFYGAELASKAFKRGSSIYFHVIYPGSLQPTYFLLKEDATIIAKIQSQLAGSSSTSGHLPKVLEQSSDLWSWPATIQNQIVTEAADLFSTKKIGLSQIDFGSNDRYFNESLGNNLLITGGYLASYDGANIVEHGFHLYPEYLVVKTSTSGGSVKAGTYLYAVVYEWYDNFGQRHQSAPSVSVTVTTTGTTSTNYGVYETLRATQKKAPVPEAQLAVYRTAAGGNIFYRLTSLTTPTLNTPTSHFATFTDTADDTSITSNEVLYTSTGELENIAPPACNLIATNKNRAFVVPSEDPSSIWYTKINGIGPNAVGFNDTFIKRVDQINGEIRGVATMDDKVVAFKQTNMLFFAGDGPLNTGEQDTFSEPQLIASDDGTNEPTSLGSSAEGIYFKAENKGIMRLSRSLQTEYIGKDVEGFKDASILSTDLLAKPHEIRFITSDGQALVYDTVQKQWGVYDNHEAVDSIVWKNNYVYLKSNGQIFKENESLSKDGNLAVPLTIETAWIKLSGIENFQRIKSLMVLGDYVSDHQLKISFAYDYQPYYADAVYWNAGEVLQASVYGGGTTYGDSEVYGGSSDSVYQVRVHVPYQKCQSIRVKIEDISSGNLGKSMNITGLEFECKMKKGVFKLRSEKTAG